MSLRAWRLSTALAAVAVVPHSTLAASPPVSSPAPPLETLQQSIERRKAFPFRPSCDGGTQGIAACLRRRRNQDNQRLLKLMDAATLEPWRASRRRACEWMASMAEGEPFCSSSPPRWGPELHAAPSPSLAVPVSR